MTILRSTMTRKTNAAPPVSSAGVWSLAYSPVWRPLPHWLRQSIVVTLLPSYADTEDTQSKGYLNVTIAKLDSMNPSPGSISDASALPAGIKEEDFESVQLQLVPKEGALREMAITVAPVVRFNR